MDFVTYEKFEKKMIEVLRDHEYEPDTDDRILRAFRVLDPERKGYLEAETMREILCTEGTPFREKEIEGALLFVRCPSCAAPRALLPVRYSPCAAPRAPGDDRPWLRVGLESERMRACANNAVGAYWHPRPFQCNPVPCATASLPQYYMYAHEHTTAHHTAHRLPWDWCVIVYLSRTHHAHAFCPSSSTLSPAPPHPPLPSCCTHM